MELDKATVLQRLSFGKRIAEEESDALADYFVETEHWGGLFRGDTDIVYGAKGTGKSALYSLLLQRADDLFDRDILTVGAENPQGTPAFSDLVSDPPTSEANFRSLWKLYFLSLIADALRDYEVANSKAHRVRGFLESAGLLEREPNLRGRLRAVRDYIRKVTNPKSAEGEVKLDAAGNPVGVVARITFEPTSATDREMGMASVDELLQDANESLEQAGLSLWILLDRLDVAFTDNVELEKNALRSLFRVYLDLFAFSRLTLKIFLRTDIWRRITEEGFREASHITRAVTIHWDSAWLMNLVVRRLLMNEVVQEFYSVSGPEILNERQKQVDFFYKVFPDQVDVGSNKPNCFDWILTRTEDGAEVRAPREVIHILDEARTMQLERLQLGDPDPQGSRLFAGSMFKRALNKVSEFKLHQTLYAEHAEQRPYIEALRERKTEQYPATLAVLWEIPESQARDVAESLVDIGFFQRRGPRSEPSYWVPFVFRPALEMSQGKAR